MDLPSMRSGLVSREFLRIAGGYGVAQVGASPAGGLDIDDGGNLATDGDLTTKGVISAGSTPQTLTDAAGLIDGGKIQDGTVTPAKLDAALDFIMNTLQLGANSIKNSQGETTITLDVNQNVTIENDLYFNGGANIGTATDPNLLGIADNAVTVNGTLDVTGLLDVTATGLSYIGDLRLSSEDSGNTLYQSAASTTLAITTNGGAIKFRPAPTGNYALEIATSGNVSVLNDLAVNGNTALGNASTDTITCTGRLIVRTVADAGPMTSTAGTYGEVVINSSNNKFYGCTATGSPATWSALN